MVNSVTAPPETASTRTCELPVYDPRHGDHLAHHVAGAAHEGAVAADAVVVGLVLVGNEGLGVWRRQVVQVDGESGGRPPGVGGGDPLAAAPDTYISTYREIPDQVVYVPAGTRGFPGVAVLGTVVEVAVAAVTVFIFDVAPEVDDEILSRISGEVIEA